MIDNQRIIEAFEYLKKNKYFRNQQDFVERIGSDKSTVSQILNGRLQSNKQFVCKVSEAFNVISENWLIDGVGEMLKSTSEPTINHNASGVPYYDVDFIGGYDLVINDKTTIPAYYIDFQQYNKADHWVNITGHSMEPLISHGDMIAIRRLEDWRTYLLPGEIYVIVTEEYRTVKKVRTSKKGDDYFRLVPLNDEFDEQDIPKSIIDKVYQVLGAAKKIF